MSFLSHKGRSTMEFACGFVYVPPVTQMDGQRSNSNVIKRSGVNSFYSYKRKNTKHLFKHSYVTFLAPGCWWVLVSWFVICGIQTQMFSVASLEFDTRKVFQLKHEQETSDSNVALKEDKSFHSAVSVADSFLLLSAPFSDRCAKAIWEIIV